MPSFRHIAGSAERGLRLDRFLAALHPELTRSRIRRLIDDGQVRLLGSDAKAGRRLRPGDGVDLVVPDPVPVALEPEALALDVLFEDADLVAVNKPAGIAVHPGAGRPRGTLVNALLHHCTDLAGISGELRPGIVHRIDKDTSGCLVAAKNDRALDGLQTAFKARRVEKTYQAIVHGVPPATGTFRTLHGRHPTDRKRFSARVRSGRAAVTSYRVLEAFDGAALLEVALHTGRTHQIRVHFGEAGHPLLGDALYGGRRREARLTGGGVKAAAAALGRQALHAWKLAFDHPATGARVRLEAPLPADLLRALRILRATRRR